MAVNFIETLTGGSTVYIRPINRNDVERERDFVDDLSLESRYFRFLGGVSHLTEEELQNFCDVDRDHEMAFVALDQSGEEDSQVGIARYVADLDNLEAEIAITIADDWQDRNLDETLLRHLLEYARNRGIKLLYSIELRNHSNMRALARKFNFESRTDPGDARQVIYELRL